MLSLKLIQQQILQAKKLRVLGGMSQVKTPHSDPSMTLLNMSQYSGIVDYHPEELVITVKSGTTVKELNRILAEKKQATLFVLPDNKNSTIGGAYAMGNSDLRDAVLGIKIIDGRGRLLNFGGQVMKNVAGYDVARLLVGSKGKMAVICEISLKIIPESYAKNTTRNIKPKSQTKKTTPSKLKMQLEKDIKNIFDPLAVFV